MKFHLLAITLLISVNAALAGGGWVYKKGKGFLKLGQSAIVANHFFNPEGQVIDITTVSLYTTSFFGEIGLSDRVTAVAYVPFFVRSTLNEIEFNQSGNTIPGDEVNALGDVDIGLKYGFFQDRNVVVAASLTFGLPLGETQGGEGEILQTGDGEFNQLLKIEASRSFYPKPFYATGTLGFNNRTEGFSDEFHFGLEVGYTASEKLTAILKTYSVNSLFNGTVGDSAGNGIFSNNTEYFSFGPEIIYAVTKKIGVTGAGGFAFSGRRILAAPNWSIGFFMNL